MAKDINIQIKNNPRLDSDEVGKVSREGEDTYLVEVGDPEKLKDGFRNRITAKNSRQKC